jgi:FkbH-like protein
MENQQERRIAIAATFVAEPVQTVLDFWMHKLGLRFAVEFAPYDQVMQQLLDPSSLLRRNQEGLNALLIRFDDWLRRDGAEEERPWTREQLDRVQDGIEGFAQALKSASEHSQVPYLVCICPEAPAPAGEASSAMQARMRDLLRMELRELGNVDILVGSELNRIYKVGEYYDPQGQRLGHMPYTAAFYSAIGTALVRRLRALYSAPYKAIVLDCDRTLWKGICAEDGPNGIQIDEPHKGFQDFVVAQHDSGLLICLCSKNHEEDVFGAFDSHPEMPLQREHIVSWRINWKPKSENIRSLAGELGIGLDSFVFIDDNPLECAEVQEALPEVLVVPMPGDPVSPARFFAHLWAFDHSKITEEDRARTQLYHQQADRERFRESATTLADFIAGLQLHIKLFEAAPQHYERIAQLTQRTNQFNMTTIRRSAEELRALAESGDARVLAVEVDDRFGDYGLVGAVIYRPEAEAIEVDTLLLSCRVLGRGVEHRILARLGEIAGSLGLDAVDVRFIPTSKNQPAFDFLEKLDANSRSQAGPALRYRFPAEYARKVEFSADSAESTDGRAPEQEAISRPSEGRSPSARPTSEHFVQIALQLSSAAQITEAIDSWNQKARMNLPSGYAAPSSPLEQAIARIWKEVLGFDRVGIQDKFSELGGSSLAAVQVIARLNKELGVELSIVDIFEAPTIESMVKRLESGSNGRQEREKFLASQIRGERRSAIARLRRK